MPQFGGGKAAAGAFFDSDFRTIDSFLALSLLYGTQAKNDCRVAVVSMSRPNLAVAGFADTVVRYYHGGFGAVTPVGMRTVGEPGETSPAFVKPFEKKKEDGTPVYKNQVKSVIDTADPSTVIRNYLEAQADQNSFLVLSGPATNLAALLAFPGAKPWIVSKAKRLVIAGGAFSGGAADARVKADIPSFRKLLTEWPTPIVIAGAEVGSAIPFPGSSIDKQFLEAAPDNPVADAYRAYQPMPYDAPSWAMTAALYAARPNENYFKLSGPGTISVDDQGRTTFAASEKGTHQHLIFDPEQKEKITLAYVELASAKPEAGGRRFRPPVDANKATPPPPPKKQ